MTSRDAPERRVLVCRGIWLEYLTLGWNIVSVPLLFVSAFVAGSGALVAFGLDSTIEIFASMVVVWELKADPRPERTRRATRLIGMAFLALAIYLIAQAAVTLATGHRPGQSLLGIGWITATAVVMFALALGKHRTGNALGNPVLIAEGKVTVMDGLLAVSILVGLVLNAILGWWWADTAASLVIVVYGVREGIHALSEP